MPAASCRRNPPGSSPNSPTAWSITRSIRARPHQSTLMGITGQCPLRAVMLAYVVVPEHNEGERVSASQRQLMGLSGLACIVGGVCIAAFVLVHPWDQLVGSEIAR